MKLLRKTREQRATVFYGIASPLPAGDGGCPWHFIAIAE